MWNSDIQNAPKDVYIRVSGRRDINVKKCSDWVVKWDEEHQCWATKRGDVIAVVCWRDVE